MSRPRRRTRELPRGVSCYDGFKPQATAGRDLRPTGQRRSTAPCLAAVGGCDRAHSRMGRVCPLGPLRSSACLLPVVERIDDSDDGTTARRNRRASRCLPQPRRATRKHCSTRRCSKRFQPAIRSRLRSRLAFRRSIRPRAGGSVFDAWRRRCSRSVRVCRHADGDAGGAAASAAERLSVKPLQSA